jgi:hypothetical protein
MTMTIAEFIKEQAKARAEAAQALIEPLEINGIKITAGCTVVFMATTKN